MSVQTYQRLFQHVGVLHIVIMLSSIIIIYLLQLSLHPVAVVLP
jgi:hypothetical protein